MCNLRCVFLVQYVLEHSAWDAACFIACTMGQQTGINIKLVRLQQISSFLLITVAIHTNGNTTSILNDNRAERS